MKGKMIFTDMDGTLLDQKKELSSGNLAAIQEASKQGIPVIFSTGRLWTAAKPYYEKAGLTTPLSACNGAVVLLPGTREILYERPLKKEALRQVLEILVEENLYHHLYSVDTIFSKEYRYTTAYYEKRNQSLAVPEDRVNIVMLQELFGAAASEQAMYKVMACSESDEALQRCHRRLQEVQEITITRSGRENLEVMAQGVSKGSALQFLCHRFQKKENHVMAIGDEQNDISMLKSAGFSVAMGNAADEIKALANYTAPHCNQNGFAAAVYDYLKS